VLVTMLLVKEGYALLIIPKSVPFSG
jgi:hypothetical protein